VIPLRDIDQALLPRLDAEGTDHYDLSLDRIPNLNAAQRTLTSALASLHEQKKFSGEALRDLTRTAVFQTNQFGQIPLDIELARGPQPLRMWGILAVYPDFESEGGQPPVPSPLPTESVRRDDIRFISPNKSAMRYTHEQWAQVRGNVFSPGNTRISGTEKEWGYIVSGTSQTSVGQQVGTTITILPQEFRLVAVSVLKTPSMVPTDILDDTDPRYATTMLEWPDSMFDLLVALTHRGLSFKQGDNTTLNSLSSQEMAILLGAVS